MNERIKELAIESEFSESELHIQADNFQKFAELIVREAILQIKMTMVRDGYDTRHYKQSRKHIETICEHFGVKE
jgi:hypothetical protein